MCRNNIPAVNNIPAFLCPLVELPPSHETSSLIRIIDTKNNMLIELKTIKICFSSSFIPPYFELIQYYNTLYRFFPHTRPPCPVVDFFEK